MKKLLIALSLLVSMNAAAQKFEGLAITPPMGWNSWNTFKIGLSEALVMDMADKMASSGMASAGYVYLVLDDGWMAKDRDKEGSLVADPAKFPHGMKFIADYVHSKGLKFGIYNCAGTLTCAKFPGTRGYEYQDARFYASLGVDYLKFDWCFADGLNAKEAYTTMSKAIKKAGRPMIFSICEWGGNTPWLWGASAGHLWRTTGDIYNCFDCIKDMGDFTALGVMAIVDKQQALRAYAGPGHWNDPDMLEVGNGMSTAEDRAHFSLWSMMSAPLMAGNDLRNMNKETAAVLTNKAVIAIDQDELGIQGYRYSVKDSLETWLKPLKGGDWAVCFLNRGKKAVSVEFNCKQGVITDTLSKKVLNAAAETFKLKDLWTGKYTGTTDKPFKANVPSHDVVMLRLEKATVK
jgi:alpha-galactosidase